MVKHIHNRFCTLQVCHTMAWQLVVIQPLTLPQGHMHFVSGMFNDFCPPYIRQLCTMSINHVVESYIPWWFSKHRKQFYVSLFNLLFKMFSMQPCPMTGDCPPRSLPPETEVQRGPLVKTRPPETMLLLVCYHWISFLKLTRIILAG